MLSLVTFVQSSYIHVSVHAWLCGDSDVQGRIQDFQIEGAQKIIVRKAVHIASAKVPYSRDHAGPAHGPWKL